MNYKSLLQFGVKKKKKKEKRENTAHILKQSLLPASCRFLWNLGVVLKFIYFFPPLAKGGGILKAR